MSISDNYYAKLLYNKPVIMEKDKFFKRLRIRIKERKYYKNTIKPVIEHLREETTSFEDMIEFSYFIKILEQVFFYRNDTTIISGQESIRLCTDISIDGKGSKSLILILDKERVSISFSMKTELKDKSIPMTMVMADNPNYYNNILTISVNNLFGKKLTTNFTVVNGEMHYDNENHYNLIFNINKLLRKSMADLFELYYKKA